MARFPEMYGSHSGRHLFPHGDSAWWLVSRVYTLRAGTMVGGLPRAFRWWSTASSKSFAVQRRGNSFLDAADFAATGFLLYRYFAPFVPAVPPAAA